MSLRRRTNRNSKIANRKLMLESLETRNVMAGTVAGSVLGGNLSLRGDDNANNVLISEVDDLDKNSATHAYLVAGVNTTITGGSAVPASIPVPAGVSARVFTNVRGNVNVDLRGGNDFLGIANNTNDLAQQLYSCGFIDLENENDPLANLLQTLNPAEFTLAGPVNIPLDLVINMGNGNNILAINANARTGNILTGSGNDLVSVGDEPGGTGIRFRQNLIIGTGGGIDEVCVEIVQIDNSLNVQLGDGDLKYVNSQVFETYAVRAGDVLVGTGRGNDVFAVDTTKVDRGIVMNSGDGADQVALHVFAAGQGNGPKGQRGAGNVSINTGTGNDLVFVGGADFSTETPVPSAATSLLLDTGPGNDGDNDRENPVRITDLVLQNQLTVFTGTGNDALLVETVAVTKGSALIDTGLDNDTATLIGLLLQGDFLLSLGAGVDSATLNNVTVGRNALIDAGAGDDTVTIDNSHVNNGLITILMGLGNNDTLKIHTSTAKRATLDGGPGNNDTLSTDIPANPNVQVRGFEKAGP